MKVRGSLRKICEQCKIVTRSRKNYVICKANPRHKQRQGFSTLVWSGDETLLLPSSSSSSSSSSSVESEIPNLNRNVVSHSSNSSARSDSDSNGLMLFPAFKLSASGSTGLFSSLIGVKAL